MVVRRLTEEQARQALARAVELARENDKLLRGSESGTSEESAVERPVDEPGSG
jgi:hypothetical protein